MTPASLISSLNGCYSCIALTQVTLDILLLTLWRNASDGLLGLKTGQLWTVAEYYCPLPFFPLPLSTPPTLSLSVSSLPAPVSSSSAPPLFSSTSSAIPTLFSSLSVLHSLSPPLPFSSCLHPLSSPFEKEEEFPWFVFSHSNGSGCAGSCRGALQAWQQRMWA